MLISSLLPDRFWIEALISHWNQTNRSIKKGIRITLNAVPNVGKEELKDEKIHHQVLRP
jgi:hypothetical protein